MTHETQRRKHWHLGSITALVATLAVVAGSLAATVAPASAAGWYRHHGTTTTTSSTTTSTSPTTTTSTTVTPSGEPRVRGFAGPPGVRFCLVRQHRRRGHGWVWVTTRARCVAKAHGQGAGNGRGGHNYSTTTTSSTTTSSTTTSSTTSTTLAAANCTAAESGTPLSRAGWVASTNALSSGADLPANALDSNLATRFSTDEPEASGLYFAVDLGSAQTFDELEMDVPNSTTDYARGYDVWVSSNGTTWTVVATCTGTGSPEIVSFPAQTSQYVEVVLTSGNPSNYWWSIDEFNLFNG